jgi:hypothetical protein
MTKVGKAFMRGFDPHPRLHYFSQAENISFLLNKFDPWAVNGGRVSVPNYGGGIDVCGLAGPR